MVVSMEQDWPEKGFKTGDLISFDLAKLKAAPDKAVATLVLRPTARSRWSRSPPPAPSWSSACWTTSRARPRSTPMEPRAGPARPWTCRPTATIGLGSTAEKDERLFLTVTGYLTPTTYWLADAGSLKLEQVKASPARFDASTHVVEQFEATPATA
jgi:prolyl oligopeptidase